MATRAKKASTSKSASTAKSKKTTAAKSASKKTAANKSVAPKKATAARKTTTKKKAASPKTSATKTAAKKTTTSKKAAASKPAAKKAAAPAKSAARKSASGKKSSAPAKPRAASAKRKKLYEELKEMMLTERKQLLGKALGTHTIKENDSHGDLVDLTNDFIDRDLMMGMAEHDRQRLQDIDEALARMENGTYGICQMSGEEISEARLMALPTAKYTLECQSRLEGRY